MRKLVAFFVLLALFCTSAIHIFAQDATQEAGVAPERPDLITLLQNDPDGRFTTLVAAIQASGAEKLLGDAGPFTLLAPTNDAFTALETQTGMTQDQLLADRATLTKVLLYHVLPGQFFFRQLTGGPELPTSLLGQSVQFDLTGGVFTVNGANISDPDNLASNGVMIAIDAVLLPPDVAAAMAAMATPEATEVTAEVVATEAPTAEATEVATPEAGVAAERPDLITLLQNDPDGRFTTLVAAIQASGAETVLDDAGPFTLLAPTNDAFAALLTQTGMTQDQLLADRATLTKVLLYHVLPGQYFFRQLTGGPEVPTSLLGQSVKFDLTGGVFTVNGANISDPDNLASNGVMIAIDAVLLPPDVAAAMATPEVTEVATEVATPTPTPEVTEAATPEATPVAVGVSPERPDLITLLQNDPDGRFTTLLAAIDAAGLADSLQGGPFTLLAPTNDAFTALETQTGMTQDQLLADKATLTNILLNHVIPGQYFFRNLTSGPTLDSLLAGSPVKFDLTGGVFTANGANISDPDNLASNGVMIAIDSVILPPDVAAALATPEPTAEPTEVVTPEPTPEVTPEAGVAVERPDLLTLLQDDPDGRFTTLIAAIQASGAETVLDDAGPFTLLAPTNDAFAALLAQTGMTQDQLLADRATLTKILLYHVLPGQYFFRQLTGGPEVPTSLLGQSVKFDLTGGVFTVNGANISDPDNLASNGVMIAIDSVILPPDVAAALPVAATPEPTEEPTAESTAVAGGAHVRFVSFSPNASSVDVSMGAGGTQANLLFGNVTAWQDITPATYDISATANGGGATASISVSIAENAWVTVAVTGTATADQLRLTALVEDYSAVAEGSARLSVFNGVEGSSSYDVSLDGNTLVIRLGYPGTQGSNDGFYTLDVTAGTYKVQFYVHNSPSNVVINLPEVSLDAGMNYFISVAGSSAAPGAVIVASPIP
ncbi:MAG: fasciclin domain-containing protein [Chloroflexota bacterium]